jgi:cation diffusion facilitator family transporter
MRAAQPATAEHPFGHGLQLYFWTFVVAILIFGLGPGLSILEGLDKVASPHPIENAHVNYAVLGLAMLFEGGAWLIAFREFRKRKGRGTLFKAVHRSKDPTVFIALFEDSAALLGLVTAFLGIALGQALNMPVLDGVASLVIGVILATTAAFLAYESQSLLTGEGVDPEVRADIRKIAAAEPGVLQVNEVLTMHFGPQDVLVAVSLDFDDAIPAGPVERAVTRIERRIKAAHPEVTRVFVEAQSFDAHRRSQRSDDPESGTLSLPQI